MSDFNLVDYDHEKHAAFVFDSFFRSVHWAAPWKSMHPAELRASLLKALAGNLDGHTKVIVPVGMPNSFLGWIAADPKRQTIIYAFVRYSARRMGVATSAAARLGIEFVSDGKPRPVGIVFWTPAAARISAKGDGFWLYHDTRRQDEVKASRVSKSGPRSAGDREGNQSE